MTNKSDVRVLTVFGTRPEAIKMVPVVKALEDADGIESLVCVTAQHRQMLDSVLEFFDVKPDIDLDLMEPGQSLNRLTSKIIARVDEALEELKPDWVLVHGDTSTSMATALAAFHRQIPVGHVEAGLRSGDLYSPFPEEFNRIVADLASTRHYAPTAHAADQLRGEGQSDDSICVTGNTVIDALLLTVRQLENDAALRERIDAQFDYLDPDKRLVLITGHRRESFGDGFDNMCHAMADIAQRDDVQLLYPVHLNPNVQKPVRTILSGLENVHLVEPVDYPTFVRLMQRSYLILTDSGGIQEEAPSLNKPVLVMRDRTERQEAIDAGVVKLVGTERQSIVTETCRLLDHKDEWLRMSGAVNPYGDGTAGQQIATTLAK